MSAFPAYSEQPQEQTQQQQQQTGTENGTSTFGNLGQNQPQSDTAAQTAGASDGAFNGNGATPADGAPVAGGTDPKTTLWYDDLRESIQCLNKY